jgi:CHAD domain-containing protein
MKTKNNILLHALDERLDLFGVQFKICRRDFSEEAVHDLRVASRRLLAALDLARVFSPRPSLQKARRELKRFLDELDELSDTQVQLVDFTDLLETFPQVMGIIKDLKKQEKKLLRAAEKELKKTRLVEISARAEKVRARLEVEIPAEGFDAALLQSVDEAFGRAKQAHSQVEAGDAESIHRLRVAFKKFRYSVEVARPLLRKVAKKLFKDMHNYQGKMGDVQDTRVMLEMLVEFAERNPKADLASVNEALEQRRAELLAAFMQNKDALFAFWRAKPEEFFPWERPDETIHHSSRNRRGGRGSRNRPAEGTDGEGRPQDGQDRARPEGIGGKPGSDPDQPLPAGDSNGGDSSQEVQTGA